MSVDSTTSTGFEFKASVTMDMVEKNKDMEDREIIFEMVESRDFAEFKGIWRLNSAENGAATLLR